MEVELHVDRNKYFLFIIRLLLFIFSSFHQIPEMKGYLEARKLSLPKPSNGIHTKLKSLNMNTRGLKTCLKPSLPVSSELCKQTLGILFHEKLFKCWLLERLPQCNKHVLYIQSISTIPILTTDRITKLFPSHGLNIEAETNSDFKQKKPGKPSRFAGSYRETVGSFSCFSFFRVATTRKNNSKKLAMKKKLVVRCNKRQRPKRKATKGSKETQRPLPLDPESPKKIQALKSTMKYPGNFQHSWRL